MFVKKLALEDLRYAMDHGWKISLKGRPVIGGMWACADFRAFEQPRYDVSFYREPDGRAMALLCTQHIPTFEGPRYEMPDQGVHAHLLELVYDPATKTCELFVDGRRQAAGYRATGSNRPSTRIEAFFFGISVYRSDRAEAELESVRFEVRIATSVLHQIYAVLESGFTAFSDGELSGHPCSTAADCIPQ